MESWNFLSQLGLPLAQMNLPRIHKVKLTSVSGKTVEQTLDIGGFGISRFKLDDELAKLARVHGVDILENTSASNFEKRHEFYEVSTTAGIFKSQIVCASFGKLAFGNFYKPKAERENWVGVKYHIKHILAEELIALHNFDGGYCGISKIEDERYCLCYLVRASQLNKYSNSLTLLEKNELYRNPYLLEIFNNATFLFEKPLTISNVNFTVKKPVDNHIFYLGDSAGTIAPLCGNGMSNALRSASILAQCLINYFNGHQDILQTEKQYQHQWNEAFKKRISIGRILQHFFCKKYLTGFFIFMVKYIKPLRQFIIRQTHGDTF
jgi:flavin-dependent dehydrogenase